MAYFLVLAKSYKTGGRCIAGKLVEYDQEANTISDTQQWIRPIPIGCEPTACVPIEFCTLSSGEQLNSLDILELNLTEQALAEGQPENYFYNDLQWIRITSLEPSNIFEFIENPPNLWLDSESESDRCTPSFVTNNVDQSLYLIRVTNLLVSLFKEINEFDGRIKHHITASFTYQGHQYQGLSITCPAVRKMLKNQFPEPNQPANITQLRCGDDYVLCVSLGPNFHNHHYKFIATIFDRTGYLQRQFNQ